MADARIEIDEALRPHPTDGTREHGRRLLKVAAAAAFVVVVVLGTWALSRLRKPDTDTQGLRLQINPPEGGRFRFVSVNRGGLGLALSPDGRTVVYAATVNGKSSLWLRAVDATAARELRGTEDAQ
jgi:hypothetical protein